MNKDAADEMINTVSEKSEDSHKAELGVRILQNCRIRLYADFPYLDGAFASVHYEADPEMKGFGTDGDAFVFSPEDLIRAYRISPDAVTRAYLHMLLHCLYLHCFPDEKIDRELWNLACDISVGLILEKTAFAAAGDRDVGAADGDVGANGSGALDADGSADGVAAVDDVGAAAARRTRFVRSFAGRTPGAAKVYAMLLDGRIHENFACLREWFVCDNHGLWYPEKADSGKRKRTKQKWEKILAYTGARQQDHQKKRGEQKGGEEEELAALKRSRYDYRTFLKKFAVPREEMEIDLDSFDYIFYNLGMEEYGDMPLIEPLEYQEVYKLEELVIAIDTSGSCDADMVRSFLSETYQMLSDKENFFKKMKVYLIQCDCCIQDVQVVHSEEEWETVCRDFKIQGRGGTDFRPVFAYVEELRKKKELKKLKALIYFTDGDGVYPREKPDYETAFVFVNEIDKAQQFPEWAQKLIV